jgi:hypothetical protein
MQLTIESTQVTIKNEKFSVTLPRVEFDAIAEGKRIEARQMQAKPSPETVAAGWILSRIHAAQEYALEAAKEAEPVSQLEVTEMARSLLISGYLEQHSRYADGETLSRYLAKRVMPARMAEEIATAKAFADSALSEEPTRELKLALFIAGGGAEMEEGSAQEARLLRLLQAMNGAEGAGAQALADAHQTLEREALRRRQYAQARATLPESWIVTTNGAPGSSEPTTSRRTPNGRPPKGQGVDWSGVDWYRGDSEIARHLLEARGIRVSPQAVWLARRQEKNNPDRVGL